MYNSDVFCITGFDVSDAQSLCYMMSSNLERFQRYFPKTSSQNLTIEDSKAYIHRKAIENKHKIELTFAIKENSTQKVAGIIILKDLDMTHKTAELAYAMDKTFEGRGWTTLAVKELSKYAFHTLGLKTLKIISHKSNLGSCKIARKNGYVWQRTLKNEHTPFNESPLDMELYELNAGH
jgi:ribosomal-protein-alanine N-acetyltransferase